MNFAADLSASLWSSYASLHGAEKSAQCENKRWRIRLNNAVSCPNKLGHLF